MYIFSLLRKLPPTDFQDVECFGDDTCYSLAFGIPAILMLIATVVIIIGTPSNLNYVLHNLKIKVDL